MKIIDKREERTMKFGELSRGATFIDDDDTICIKADDPESGLEYFAVSLVTGCGIYMDADDVVIPIDAELIVRRTL